MELSYSSSPTPSPTAAPTFFEHHASTTTATAAETETETTETENGFVSPLPTSFVFFLPLFVFLILVKLITKRYIQEQEDVFDLTINVRRRPGREQEQRQEEDPAKRKEFISRKLLIKTFTEPIESKTIDDPSPEQDEESRGESSLWEEDLPTHLENNSTLTETKDTKENNKNDKGQCHRPSSSSMTDHSFSKTCYICLENYEHGEEIAWSPNPDCEHVFHACCITGWLMKHDACPLCRQDFLMVPSNTDDEHRADPSPLDP